MKKWLTGCLIGCLMALLFMTTPAFAHTKADGTKCPSIGYNKLPGSENQTETQHRMQCRTCGEIMWENHWRVVGDEPTCKTQVRCGLCGIKFGALGEHKFSTATCVAKATCSVCKLQTGEIDPDNHDLKHNAAKAPTCTEKGWDAYDTCSRCSYTTYRKLPALDHDKVHHDAKAATCLEIGWDAYEDCRREGCTYTTRKEILALNHDIEKHAAKTPTCTEIGWDAYEDCTREGCTYTTYQEQPVLGHDKVHHDAKAATCLEIGWDAYDTCSRCSYTTYRELPALGHDKVHHDAKAATCLEIGWDAYDTCSRCSYTTYQEQPVLGHDKVHHDAKAATCLEIGWDAYDTRSRCSYTTYQEQPVLGHDKVHHDAKAATCLEIGWDAYDTCSRCDYTTYVEKKALGHKLVNHVAKAPTCTDIGWKTYDTCSRCDYTTYVELLALNHDYQDTIVQPACEADGYTLHTCVRCKDAYADTIVSRRGHWYGEWMPIGDDAHRADCLRSGCKYAGNTACQKFDFVMDKENMVFCPVCGEVENGERLELIEKASAAAVTGKLPAGELVARMKGECLSLAFELAGGLAQPTGQVKITLPAELVQGKRLVLITQDGTQTDLTFEVQKSEIFFTLDFTKAEVPVMFLRLIPES